MKKNLSKILLSLFLLAGQAHALVFEDLDNLRNDKEVTISSFNKDAQKKIIKKYVDQNFNLQIKNHFYASVEEFLVNDNLKCEMSLVSRFEKKLSEKGIAHDEKSMNEYYQLLRVRHDIDDIFYELLKGITKDVFSMREINLTKKVGNGSWSKKMAEANDLQELYSGLSSWANESDRCAYQEFMALKLKVRNKKRKLTKKLSDLKKLNRMALQAGYIPLDVYHRLEYLREKSFITKRDLWLQDYFKIIFNAKNKLIPQRSNYVIQNIEDEDEFASKRLKRFSRLTRRKLLYRKYDETQIILLAQILQKASRRMGVDPDTITKAPILIQEFSLLNDDGERENYVEQYELDTQSQYNLARRLMRKDIVEIQMMSSFNKLVVTYEDVVMAALETGYISLEDLEFVVRYDDLWNPTKTKFQRIIGFIFDVSGYGTFFLPPPWNITASIALSVVEGVIDNKTDNGAGHDNPATFIE